VLQAFISGKLLELLAVSEHSKLEGAMSMLLIHPFPAICEIYLPITIKCNQDKDLLVRYSPFVRNNTTFKDSLLIILFAFEEKG